jgi:hypothetical protein
VPERARSARDSAYEARSLLLFQGQRLCVLSNEGRLPIERASEQSSRGWRRLSALLRARRRRDRWSDQDRWLYQRHRWRSEGFHGEAKSWHGLARAIRRGLANMRIQAYLTAAAIDLKRLAAALFALTARWLARFTQSGRPTPTSGAACTNLQSHKRKPEDPLLQRPPPAGVPVPGAEYIHCRACRSLTEGAPTHAITP